MVIKIIYFSLIWLIREVIQLPAGQSSAQFAFPLSWPSMVIFG